jgi:hypothetical protein
MTRYRKMARRIIREIIEAVTDRYGDPVMATEMFLQELEKQRPDYESDLTEKLRRFSKKG